MVPAEEIRMAGDKNNLVMVQYSIYRQLVVQYRAMGRKDQMFYLLAIPRYTVRGPMRMFTKRHPD